MFFIYVAILALLAHAVPGDCFSASLTLDASAREIHETNVNPLFSGAARAFAGDDQDRQMPAAARITRDSVSRAGPSGTDTADFHTVLNASAGAASIIGPEADLSIRAELERQQFRRFSELNATTAGVRSVLTKQFSDVHSVRLGLNGRRTEYHLDALTGSGFSVIFGLRQQTASRFCLDEALLYERYRAKENIRYAGNGLTLQAGYRLSPLLTSALSYGFLSREFELGNKTAVHSLALSGTWEPVRHFSISASFEHQRYEYHVSGSHESNSIAAAGLGCSY